MKTSSEIIHRGSSSYLYTTLGALRSISALRKVSNRLDHIDEDEALRSHVAHALHSHRPQTMFTIEGSRISDAFANIRIDLTVDILKKDEASADDYFPHDVAGADMIPQFCLSFHYVSTSGKSLLLANQPIRFEGESILLSYEKENAKRALLEVIKKAVETEEFASLDSSERADLVERSYAKLTATTKGETLGSSEIERRYASDYGIYMGGGLNFEDDFEVLAPRTDIDNIHSATIRLADKVIDFLDATVKQANETYAKSVEDSLNEVEAVIRGTYQETAEDKAIFREAAAFLKGL